MRILVVCGAGASSTFVAQRLRRAAHHAGLDWETTAGSEQAALSGGADLVLVGPHLADRVAIIRDASHCPVAALPEDVFADRDGTRTLAFTRSVLSDVLHSPKGTP